MPTALPCLFSSLRGFTRFVAVAAWTICAQLSVQSSFAAAPELARLTPSGGQRGTEVELQLQGARLGDAQQLP
jgi:hypothetical protein